MSVRLGQQQSRVHANQGREAHAMPGARGAAPSDPKARLIWARQAYKTTTNREVLIKGRSAAASSGDSSRKASTSLVPVSKPSFQQQQQLTARLHSHALPKGIQAAQSKRAPANPQAVALERVVVQLRSQLAEVEGQARDAQSRVEALFEAQIQELRQTIADKDQRIELVTAASADNDRQVSAYAHRVAEMEVQAESLKQQLQAQEQTIADKDQRIELVTAASADNDRQVSAYAHRVAEMEVQVESLKQQLQAQEQTIAQYDAAAAVQDTFHKEELQEKLQSQALESALQVKQFEEQLGLAIAAVEMLEQQIQAKVQTIDIAQHEMQAQSQAMAELQSQAGASAAEVAQLQEQLQFAKANVESLKQQLQDQASANNLLVADLQEKLRLAETQRIAALEEVLVAEQRRPQDDAMRMQAGIAFGLVEAPAVAKQEEVVQPAAPAPVQASSSAAASPKAADGERPKPANSPTSAAASSVLWARAPAPVQVASPANANQAEIRQLVTTIQQRRAIEGDECLNDHRGKLDQIQKYVNGENDYLKRHAWNPNLGSRTKEAADLQAFIDEINEAITASKKDEDAADDDFS